MYCWWLGLLVCHLWFACSWTNAFAISTYTLAKHTQQRLFVFALCIYANSIRFMCSRDSFFIQWIRFCVAFKRQKQNNHTMVFPSTQRDYACMMKYSDRDLEHRINHTPHPAGKHSHAYISNWLKGLNRYLCFCVHAKCCRSVHSRFSFVRHKFPTRDALEVLILAFPNLLQTKEMFVYLFVERKDEYTIIRLEFIPVYSLFDLRLATHTAVQRPSWIRRKALFK